MNHVIPTQLRRKLGFLTKKPCIFCWKTAWGHDLLFPSARLQTSVWSRPPLNITIKVWTQLITQYIRSSAYASILLWCSIRHCWHWQHHFSFLWSYCVVAHSRALFIIEPITKVNSVRFRPGVRLSLTLWNSVSNYYQQLKTNLASTERERKKKVNFIVLS